MSDANTTGVGIPKAMIDAAGTAARSVMSQSRGYCADEMVEAVLTAAGVSGLWKSACEYKDNLNKLREQDRQSERFCKELVIRCADGLRSRSRIVLAAKAVLDARETTGEMGASFNVPPALINELAASVSNEPEILNSDKDGR